jgi:hypothetical protein
MVFLIFFFILAFTSLTDQLCFAVNSEETVYPVCSEDEPVHHPRRCLDPLLPPSPTKSLEVAARDAHIREMRAILLPVAVLCWVGKC